MSVAPESQTNDPETNLPYLFAVYIITWGGFFLFLFYVSRRQRQVRAEIETLKTILIQLRQGDTSEPKNQQEN